MRRISTSVTKLLVCIYTCEKHKKLLYQFKDSVLGQYLRALRNTITLDVYANPDVSKSFHHNKRLVLRAEEEYSALSLKTHKMMTYCVNHFEFQHLLKIDVTTIMTCFTGYEYEGRKPIDIDKLILFLKNAPYEKDYNGFIRHGRATRNNAENWAAKKGKIINYEKVFGDSSHLPPFFSGKCYLVSNLFARYISQYGEGMAEEHEKYFLGAEDVMIGRLYGKFKGSPQ